MSLKRLGMLRIEDQHADSLPISTGTARGWQSSRCSQLPTVTACEDWTGNRHGRNRMLEYEGRSFTYPSTAVKLATHFRPQNQKYARKTQSLARAEASALHSRTHVSPRLSAARNATSP